MKYNNAQLVAALALNFKISACNLRCSYCYVANHSSNILDIPYTDEEIRRAFKKERLGGSCLINVCSDGEPLIHPRIIDIIKIFLDEGHYVMIVTNGTIGKQIQRLLEMPGSERIFFKVSFHYEELKKRNLLNLFFDNMRKIKKSDASFTIEYTTTDDFFVGTNRLDIDEFKKLCYENLDGVYPHINIPREDRGKKRGVFSRYTFNNYLKKWEEIGIESAFFDFKKQIFGKKYKDYCYAGERSLWISMEDGMPHQCYHTPPIQNFMEDINKPVKWLAVGNNCSESYCYSAHFFMTLGIAPFPDDLCYKPTHDEIRNRLCLDESEWIKEEWKKILQKRIVQREHKVLKKVVTNKLNKLLLWKGRMS